MRWLTPVNLQLRAQSLARLTANHGKRFYVHNGRGVVAALLVKPHGALDVLRDDYLQFDGRARDERTAFRPHQRLNRTGASRPPQPQLKRRHTP